MRYTYLTSKIDSLSLRQGFALERNETIIFSSFLSLLTHFILVVGVGFILYSSNIQKNMELLLAQEKAKKEPLKVEYKATVAQQSSGESADDVLPSTSYKPLFTSLEFLPHTQLMFSSSSQGEQSSFLLTDREQRDNVLSFSQTKVSESGFSGAESNSRVLSTYRDELQMEIANMETVLGDLREQQARRPRIKRYTSIAAQAAVEAAYIYRWVNKIETVGNLNYPRDAVERKIDGSLRLLVALDSEGRLIGLKLLQSSGHRLLDDAAKSIVRLTEPFESFPPELSNQADIIEIVRTWHFFSDRQEITFK